MNKAHPTWPRATLESQYEASEHMKAWGWVYHTFTERMYQQNVLGHEIDLAKRRIGGR